MDIVGSLPHYSSEKRYILVICDYGTRYPEAVALRTIDANAVAEEILCPSRGARRNTDGQRYELYFEASRSGSQAPANQADQDHTTLRRTAWWSTSTAR